VHIFPDNDQKKNKMIENRNKKGKVGKGKNKEKKILKQRSRKMIKEKTTFKMSYAKKTKTYGRVSSEKPNNLLNKLFPTQNGTSLCRSSLHAAHMVHRICLVLGGG
jgi:hypothetical protein